VKNGETSRKKYCISRELYIICEVSIFMYAIYENTLSYKKYTMQLERAAFAELRRIRTLSPSEQESVIHTLSGQFGARVAKLYDHKACTVCEAIQCTCAPLCGKPYTQRKI
jgi:hypothetical protein